MTIKLFLRWVYYYVLKNLRTIRHFRARFTLRPFVKITTSWPSSSGRPTHILYSSYTIVTRTLILIGVRFRTTVSPATPPSSQPEKSATATTNYCRNFCNSTKFFGTVTVAAAGENSRPQNAYPTRIIWALQSVTRANHAWLFTATPSFTPSPKPPRTTYNVVIILFRCQTVERLDLCGPGKQLPPKTRRATCELKQKRRENTRGQRRRW